MKVRAQCLFVAIAGTLFVCLGIALAATPPEITLYKEQQQSNDVIALRRAADELLQTKPQSFVAVFVKGLIEYDKGHYAEAINYYLYAKTVLYTWQKNTPASQNEPQWEALLLYRIAETYGAMDRRLDELRILDEYDRMHFSEFETRNNIARPAARLRVVALLKLGRIDEADRLVNQTINGLDSSGARYLDFRRDAAKVAFARQSDGLEAYEIYQDIAARKKASGMELDGPLLYSLGFHALRQLDLELSSRFYREAATRISLEDATNPLERLSEIHTAQCHWDNTKDDLIKAWQWLRTKRGRVRQEMAKDLALSVALASIAMGYPEQALQSTEASLDDPQRSGDTMATQMQWKARAAFVRLLALDQTERFERSIVREMPLKARTKWLWVRLNRAIETLIVRNQLRAFLSSELTAAGKPTDALSLIGTSPSFWIELPRLVGATACRELLMTCPIHGKMKQGYEEALLAEIEYRSGRMDIALTRAEAALATLPGWENMLRARMYLLCGMAKRSRGSSAASEFVSAYRLFPGVFLKAGERFPVAINIAPDSPNWAVVALRVCSQLRVDNVSGLTLFVSGDHNSARFKVATPTQEELTSFDISVPATVTSGQSEGSVVVSSLQRNLFAVRPLLTSTELSALSGSSVATGPLTSVSR